MERDINERESDEPTANADSKLKTIAHYAMLAFAPVISVVALLVAVSHNQSLSDRAQLSELASRIDSLNASQSETKGELDNLKFAVAREKTLRGEEHKKSDERDAKIAQNVTRLQTKLKVSPTLEEQLRETTSVPVVTPPAASAASAPALAATDKMTAVEAPASIDKKQITSISAPKDSSKASAQSKALKDAIEKFNNK